MVAQPASAPQKKEANPLAIDVALGMMGDKYTLAIIERIYQNNAMRFLALEQGIPGISPRTLSIRLKQLDVDGLIHRQAFAQKPPKVEYTLTEKGIALAHAIQPLSRWALQHHNATEKVAEPELTTV
jgi:DNA-binding HxlR family transcriptional regulator